MLSCGCVLARPGLETPLPMEIWAGKAALSCGEAFGGGRGLAFVKFCLINRSARRRGLGWQLPPVLRALLLASPRRCGGSLWRWGGFDPSWGVLKTEAGKRAARASPAAAAWLRGRVPLTGPPGTWRIFSF